MKNMDKGLTMVLWSYRTHSNKMGADKLFEKKEGINKNIVKLLAYFLNIFKDQSTVSVTFWQRGKNPGKV